MKAFKSISAVVLALLVLVSSTSIMIGIHVCMDEVQTVAFFSKAGGCEKEQALPPCHRDTTAPCCEDETVIHQGNDFNTWVSDLLIFSTPVDINHPLIVISEVIPSAPTSLLTSYHYDPPLRSSDLTIVQQVFLI